VVKVVALSTCTTELVFEEAKAVEFFGLVIAVRLRLRDLNVVLDALDAEMEGLVRLRMEDVDVPPMRRVEVLVNGSLHVVF
jgi:hypothetical protein